PTLSRSAPTPPRSTPPNRGAGSQGRSLSPRATRRVGAMAREWKNSSSARTRPAAVTTQRYRARSRRTLVGGPSGVGLDAGLLEGVVVGVRALDLAVGHEAGALVGVEQAEERGEVAALPVERRGLVAGQLDLGPGEGLVAVVLGLVRLLADVERLESGPRLEHLRHHRPGHLVDPVDVVLRGVGVVVEGLDVE